MNALKCSGCPRKLKEVPFLHCCRCPDKFHHSCVNFNKVDFLGLTKDFKESWVCPNCRCKEPKRGDNSNTPVRSSVTPVQEQVSTRTVSATSTAVTREASPHENITLRTKPHSSGSCSCISSDSIRDIIREELDRKFHTQIDDIYIKLTNFEESVSFITKENDRLCQENVSHKALISQLQVDNGELRTVAYDLSHRLHQMEQLSRTNNIEVQCVPEHKNENIYTTVQQLGNAIKCPVADSDLQYCSRIAKLNNKSPRPRSILVKFSSRRLRDNFLASVVRFNKNNPKDKLNTGHVGIAGQNKTPVYVTEHLTREVKSLHAAARRAAKQLQYKFVWVRDGKVFLRQNETSGFIHIRSEESLQLLTQNCRT